ncbi:MAG: hypothetical protein MR209_02865 [Veillonellaceae bacterium]|nr:hypothetical protein [Veillonellaceae bacterium]
MCGIANKSTESGSLRVVFCLPEMWRFVATDGAVLSGFVPVVPSRAEQFSRGGGNTARRVEFVLNECGNVAARCYGRRGSCENAVASVIRAVGGVCHSCGKIFRVAVVRAGGDFFVRRGMCTLLCRRGFAADVL